MEAAHNSMYLLETEFDSVEEIRGKLVEKASELSIIGSAVSEKSLEFEDITRKTPDSDYWLETMVVNPVAGLGSVLKDLVNSVHAGMASGYSPSRFSKGSGCAYFLNDFSGNKYAAVFKPINEEAKAVNNPRGQPISLDGEGLKRNTRVGEGPHREVAAYILDHPKGGRRLFFDNVVGFACVPPTIMVKCLHSGFNHPKGYEGSAKKVKFGSLQMFQKNYGSCEDMGPGVFPVQEVHKISVLDIRLANADRHAGNILVPTNFEDCTFDWLSWPQAPEPYNADTVDYIMSMDNEQDIALLKFHGWELSLECSHTLRISTMLLMKFHGAQRGMPPEEIGSIMCRETLNKESVIEEIIYEAQESILPSISETAFLEDLAQIMDRHLDELVAKKGIWFSLS